MKENNKVLIVCFLLAYASVVLGQVKKINTMDLDGNYYNESGYCLQIKKDSFKLIVRETSPLTRSSEIWAEGTIRQIDESFIELNSRNSPWEKVQREIEVIQKKRNK